MKKRLRRQIYLDSYTHISLVDLSNELHQTCEADEIAALIMDLLGCFDLDGEDLLMILARVQEQIAEVEEEAKR